MSRHSVTLGREQQPCPPFPEMGFVLQPEQSTASTLQPESGTSETLSGSADEPSDLHRHLHQ